MWPQPSELTSKRKFVLDLQRVEQSQRESGFSAERTAFGKVYESVLSDVRVLMVAQQFSDIR